MHSISFFIVGLTMLLTAAACSHLVPSFYDIDLRQGNYIDAAKIAALRPGMTKQEVQFLLGTPLLSDPFHVNRWDYVYRFQTQEGQVEQRHVTLFFEGDLLSHIEGNPASP
jgi:outer membrane protein assembly factor BamE